MNASFLNSQRGFTSGRKILAPKNTVVNIINDLIAQRITGEEQTYLPAESVAPQEDQVIPYSAEFLNILTPPGMPPQELRPKGGVYRLLYCATLTPPAFSATGYG